MFTCARREQECTLRSGWGGVCSHRLLRLQCGTTVSDWQLPAHLLHMQDWDWPPQPSANQKAPAIPLKTPLLHRAAAQTTAAKGGTNMVSLYGQCGSVPDKRCSPVRSNTAETKPHA
jgi:hypothetical protein